MNTVGYQGIGGSYSESLISFYIEDSEAISCKTFRDIFIKLKNDEIKYGLIPIENNYIIIHELALMITILLL